MQTDSLPQEICYVAEARFADKPQPELRLVVLHRKTKTVRVMQSVSQFPDQFTAESQAVEINFLLGWNQVSMLEEINQLTQA